MICSQCGTENEAGDKFCEQCGAPLSAPGSDTDGGFAGGFSATIMAGPAAPSVLVRLDENGEQAYPLGSRAVIGRLDTCDVPINDKSVSREHARLSRLRDGYVIEDLGSTNGTLVNGRRIDEAVILHPGDIVTVGSIDFRFDIEGAGAGQDDTAGGWKTEAMPTPTTWSFPSDAANQSLDTWRATQSASAEVAQPVEQEQPQDGRPVTFPPLEPFAAPPPVHEIFGGQEAVQTADEGLPQVVADGAGEQPQTVEASVGEQPPAAETSVAEQPPAAKTPVAEPSPPEEAAPVEQVVSPLHEQEVSAPVAQATSSRPSIDDTTEMAEQLTGLIQDLARQLREARTERDALQQRLPTLEEAGVARSSVRQSLQNLPTATVSTETMQSLRELLDSLAQSPKDIELLMQVASHSSDLAGMVNDYIQLQGTVDDIAGHVGLRPAQ